MLELYIIFFFNDTATTEIYTLSLHDALPIWRPAAVDGRHVGRPSALQRVRRRDDAGRGTTAAPGFHETQDRKSTRLNSSHANISYAVFCLKKKSFNIIIGSLLKTSLLYT